MQFPSKYFFTLQKSKSEQLLAQPEPIVVKEKVKKSKKSVEPAPEQVVEVAKTHKKRAAEPVIEVAPPTSSEPKKKKKKKSEPIAEVVEEVPEKKKSKKRKLDESIEEMKPKPKKLNILAQIEDPHHSNRNLPSRQESSKGAAEQPFSVPLASQKIKKIIPEVAKVDKKKRKKSTQRVIPEPENSLPRPIWTSAGIFIEEPISPFKFTSTKYVPISSNSSTKFGVVAFDAKKKKPQQMQAPHLSGDFKTQAMLRNKNRDGSSKNIRGLLGVRNTF